MCSTRKESIVVIVNVELHTYTQQADDNNTHTQKEKMMRIIIGLPILEDID